MGLETQNAGRPLTPCIARPYISDSFVQRNSRRVHQRVRGNLHVSSSTMDPELLTLHILLSIEEGPLKGRRDGSRMRPENHYMLHQLISSIVQIRLPGLVEADIVPRDRKSINDFRNLPSCKNLSDTRILESDNRKPIPTLILQISHFTWESRGWPG